MGYSYVFNPLAGAFDTVQDFQTVTAPDNAYIPPTGPVVFQDSFTEPLFTLLNNHTPNVGTSWSLVYSTSSTTFSVNNQGSLQPTITANNVGCLYLANNSSPSAAVEVGITVPTVVSGTNTVGLVFRYVDANNFYLVTISSNAGNVVLYKKVAGVWSSLGSSFRNIAAGNQIKVRAVGSNIVVLLQDAPVIMRIDTGISGAGLCGISAGTIGQNATDDSNNSWRLDNFYVQNYASGGGDNRNAINVTGDIAVNGQVVGHNINSQLYPAFTFAGDLDTGIYRSAPDNISFVTAGAIRATFTTTALSVSGPCYVSNGSATAPTLSFGSDSNTGFFLYATDVIGIATNGATRWTINNAGLLATLGASIIGNTDIATALAVTNSGGQGRGFKVFNTSDYVTASFESREGEYGGGIYSDGTIRIYAGEDYYSYNQPGINLYVTATNYGLTTGDINIQVGPVYDSAGGNIFIKSGNSDYNGAGGSLTLAAGDSADSVGGATSIVGGIGPSGGDTTIQGGYGNSANGGTLYLRGGNAANTSYGGTVYISGGDDGGGNYGPVVIQPANGGNIGVFGSSGSIQATTGVAAATVISGTGANIKEDDTFDGYTIAQVVYALRLYGWLA